MAQFLEVIIETEKGIGEGFIRGFFRGRGITSPIYNLERIEVEKEGLKNLLSEFFHPGEEILHLLIKNDDFDCLKEAMNYFEKDGFVAKMKKTHLIKGVEAQFEISVFDKKRGEKIKKLLDESSKIIKERDFKEEKRGKGGGEVALYSIDHQYHLKGRGIIEGDDIELFINLYLQLSSLGVEFRKIKIE